MSGGSAEEATPMIAVQKGKLIRTWKIMVITVVAVTLSLNSWQLCLGLVFSVSVIETFSVHGNKQSGPEEAQGCKIRRKVTEWIWCGVFSADCSSSI